ncbi:MAG: magnesium transporter [Candidatus Limnocylindria bacterium]
MTRPTLTGTPDAVPTVELDELLEGGDLELLDRWLAQADVVEIADELSRLPRESRAVPFRLLARDRALEVFERLDPSLQQELLEGLRDTNVRQLFEEMDPDDRARLTEEMPAKVARRLLAGLSANERQLTATLLGYAEDSAGRLMSPEVASLRAGMTVADALERLRRIGRSAETIYALPVTDDHRRLVGALGLRDLVLADPATLIGDLMDTDVFSARVDADQEVVARLVRDADLLALPIVDGEDRLVGIVTVDDAMEVLEEEETEDLARAGGAEPLGRPYMATSVLQIARSRVVWLLFLIVAATLTVNVLQLFEGTLDQVVALALFIPLVIGTGGNTGAQAATTVTRALAVGEVRFGDMGVVVLREARVGLLLGAMLGLLALGPAWFFAGREIAIVVGLTLLAVCTLAAFVGAFLPLVARRVGVDPAVMSAPFITTLVDASGLVLYFLIARAVLGL